MIKMMALIARRPELSHEEFIRHWVDVHAPLVRALPGLRRYVQDHVIDERHASAVPKIGAGIDGIAELWFDDADSLDRAYASEAAAAAADDGALFISRITFFVMEEQVLIPGA